MLDAFVKTYADRNYTHATMVRHKGVVLAFAMDERRRILYTVLDATATAARDADLWLGSPRELAFPPEIATVGLAVADQTRLPVVRKGSTQPVAAGTPVADAEVDPLLSTTARFTADAPFQVVSDGACVFVFRESISVESDPDLMLYGLLEDGSQAVGDDGAPIPLVDGTLLVDRYVLVGSELQSKREVRFQRSRSRTRPASNKDSLGAADLENRPFVEPTQALPFASGLSGGRFAVVLVPTQVADVSRWQIFVASPDRPLIDSYSIERSADGLFNTRGGDPQGGPGDYAGAALSFTQDGDHVEIPAGVALGLAFTVEAWIKPAAPAPAGDLALFGAVDAGGNAAKAGPSAWVSRGTRIRFGFGDGTAFRDTTSGDIVTPGVWQHVAISFDGVYVRVYVGGELRHRSAALHGVARGQTPLNRIGADAASFRGRLDEVRVWHVARSASAIATSLGRRLTGLEPDLAAYWRLDDVAGDTIWDGSRNGGADGSVIGATWVSSDAPIAEATGLRRTSLRVYPRAVTSGLSALLYNQQERVPSGYDGAEKPLKRAARVMLAMATSGGEPDGRHRIAVVDFGVGLDGSLAQVPTELSLPVLDRPPAPGGSIDERLAEITRLEARIAELEPQVAAAMLAWEQLPRIDQVLALPSSFTLLDLGSLPTGLRNQLTLYGRLNGTGPGADYWRSQILAARAPIEARAHTQATLTAQLAQARTDLNAAQNALGGTVAIPMPPIHVDPEGLSAMGGVLEFASSPETPVLFDSALGRVALYFRGDDDQFLAASYSTLTGRGRLVVPATSGALSFFTRTVPPTGADDDAPPVTVAVDAPDGADTCTLTLTLVAPAGTISETWRNVPRDPQQLADVLNGAAAVPVFAGTAGAASGVVKALPVPDGTKVSLAVGAVVRLGDQRLRVRATAPAGSTTVRVDSASVIVAAGTAMVAVGYDYASDVRTTQVPANVATGSNVVSVDVRGASGQVVTGPATWIAPTATCEWLAPTPGGALALDGIKSYVVGEAATLPDPTAGSDLTVETWIKPGARDGVARVVAGPGFSLALRAQPGALRFDGTHDAVIVPTSSRLQFAGEITLEAWVRPEAEDLTGARSIVQHGPRADNPAEVFLRMIGGQYQVGGFDATTASGIAQWAVPSGDIGRWVHLAGVWSAGSWRLYHDGVEVATARSASGALSVGSAWSIAGTMGASGEPGTATIPPQCFQGAIDEVRIWAVGRAPDAIAADRSHRLTGSEPGLVGLWRPGLSAVFRYVDRPGAPAHVVGAPEPTAGPFASYTAVASLRGQQAESRETLPADRWSHLAVVHHQAWGVQLGGNDAYLDCGTNTTLDLFGELTLELGVRLDDLARPHGLVGRGTVGGDAAGVPYALAIDTDGRLVFTYTDSDGVAHSTKATTALTPGTFHRVAVTRRRTTQVDTPSDPTKIDPSKLVHSWQDVAFVVDGAAAGGQRFTGADPQSSGGSTLVGRTVIGTPGADGTASEPPVTTPSLRGAISEVRVWNVARPREAIGATLTGAEAGLVSWWRLDDNVGSTATDAKSSNHATLHGEVSWVVSPDSEESTLVVYRDGTPLTLAAPAAPIGEGALQLVVGALANPDARVAELLQGQLTELRIWRTARTAQQIADNLFRRLTGELEDILAYYRFDVGAAVTDHGLRGRDLALVQDAATVVSTAPLGDEGPQVRDALAGVPTDFNERIAGAPAIAEYAVLEADANGNLGGAFKRCYATASGGRWQLVTGYKVGDLVAEWIGQAQFDPQLIGFIEGAPPVPSENLTVADSYADASRVALTQADSTTFTYASTRDRGFDMSVEASFGVGPAEELSAGVGIVQKLLEAGANIGVKTTFENSLGWLDSAETGTGHTLTQVSALALRGTKERADRPRYRALGPRYVPANTGFALVQSQTADVFALRLQHTGALVSYQMRPNPDIPRDWNIVTFPIDPHYTKQGTLDGKVGVDPDIDYPQALTYSPDSSYFKPIEAYALKNRIVQDEQRARALYDQYDAGSRGRRQLGMGGATDLGTGELLDKLKRDAKRNLVNTYVWTADGGQFSEEEQTLDTVRESTGGSYAFKGLAGLQAGFEVEAGNFKVTGELTAMFGGHLNLTVTKARDSQSSFSVTSTATPESDITTPGNDGKTVRQPGKVDAYRYMTFYLEPEPEHYDAFFARVVDPIWLSQSDDPAAIALRNARQPGKRPACWRVLHRVTYVSRVLAPVPATPGAPPSFTQALRQLDIDSNYELIRVLDPYLRDKTGRYADFVAAAQDAIRRYLPALEPHRDAALSFLVLYYGVIDSPMLAPAVEDDLSRLAPTPPVVRAGPSGTFTLAEGVTLEGSAVDEQVDAAALTATWSVQQGRSTDVTFADPHAFTTTATIAQKGTYVLRLTVTDGRLSGYADVSVTMVAPPAPAKRPAPAAPGR